MYKILLINDQIESKYSAMVLEKAMESALFLSCQFTIVSDGFTGLECLQFSHYDALIVKKDMKFLPPTQLCRVLQDLNIKIPVVLLTDFTRQDSSTGHIWIPYHPIFVLSNPFTTRQLCEILKHALNFSSPSIKTPAWSRGPSRSAQPEYIPMEDDEKDADVNYVLQKRRGQLDSFSFATQWPFYPESPDLNENSSFADSFSEFSERVAWDDLNEEEFSIACEPITEESEAFLQTWRDSLNVYSPREHFAPFSRQEIGEAWVRELEINELSAI